MYGITCLQKVLNFIEKKGRKRNELKTRGVNLMKNRIEYITCPL